MIDNTFEKADGPLHATRAEAVAASGAVYLHVKGGGIYRRMGSAKYAGDACAAALDGCPMSVYEHLWPHPHEFYVRPDHEFVEIVKTEAGTHRRFEFLTNAQIVAVADA